MVIDHRKFEEYRTKFYCKMGDELRARVDSVPAAAALLVVQPLSDPTMVHFDLMIMSVDELLPEGKEEIEALLYRGLHEWMKKNYSGSVTTDDVVGTA